MKKLITRNYLFEGKNEDYSTTIDFRVMATEKKLLDLIAEYSSFDESTNFEIYKNTDLKITFSREDFENENVDLTLKQASALCVEIDIIENIVKTSEDFADSKKSINIVKSRLVKLYY